MTRKKVLVAGVGMVPFTKPSDNVPYQQMGAAAAAAALTDAGLTYDKVEQAFVGYVFGDSTCGQSALYSVGLTGIPIINVNNNCSTGSTALAQATELVLQLRGVAGRRQVEGAGLALQHNIGLGGACIVTRFACVDG